MTELPPLVQGTVCLSCCPCFKSPFPLTVGAIAVEAMKIAAEICIYTNDQICLEELEEQMKALTPQEIC